MRKALKVAVVTSALAFGVVGQAQAANSSGQPTMCPAGGLAAVPPFTAPEADNSASSLSDLIDRYTADYIRQAIDRERDLHGFTS